MSLIVAHTEAHTLAAAAWRQWRWEPLTLAFLITSGIVYAAGLTRLYRRAGAGRGIRRWEAAAFFLGLATIGVAVLSPVAWLSEQLFSVHMVQHALLMSVAAPLIVLGRPIVVFLWDLPTSWRAALGRAMDRPAAAACWPVLTAPLTVFALYGLALWLWHVPAFYQAALVHESVHIAEHACFLLGASLFWWAMLHGRYGQVGYGVAVMYVFLTAMHSGVLGALITVQPRAMYTAYAAPGIVWHVDPVADQQLAGLLMWVPFGVVYIVLGLALLAAWIGQSARRVRIPPGI